MKDNQWIFLPAGIALAVLASILTGRWSGPRSEARGLDASALAQQASLQELSEELLALAERQADLEARWQALEAEPHAGASTRSAVGLLDLAVERWMAENAPALVGADEALPDQDADAAIEASTLAVLAAGLSEEERSAAWAELIAAGELPEVIALLEDMAARAPGDPDLQLSLAEAYTHQVFEIGHGPLQVIVGEKADAAYDRVLELDASSWDARFGKAFTLSRQPTMLGKSGEAILELKTLIDQQEARPSEARFVRSYFLLGNLYADRGQHDAAEQAWRAGLQRFPGNSQLQSQLETQSGGDR